MCSAASPLRSPGFAIEPEITARLVQQGERIFEVPGPLPRPLQRGGQEADRARRLPRDRDAAALPALAGLNVGRRLSGRRAGASVRSPRLADHPFLVATLVCTALAAISAAVLPTVPSYDPWSWVVWGREVFDPHLSFFVGGGPSWKPLPVVFTAVFGLFGGAAPTLWVIAARTGGLLGGRGCLPARVAAHG